MKALNDLRFGRPDLKSRWNLGNEVLYRLCEEHPRHTKEDEILAKIWLIGRSYSAAIERRKDSREPSGEAFYTTVVGPKIRRANIDKWLTPLSRHSRPTFKNCGEIIEAHKRLTNLFNEITGLEKRSLASKYLHFHFRNLFYIYDSRAARGLAKVSPRLRKLPVLENYDHIYASHFVRSLNLVDSIERELAYT